jgi:DNA polymerase-1
MAHRVLVADIEADNLLDNITKVHCAGCIDVDTGEEFFFRPHEIDKFLAKLDEAQIIVFHNAMGYDLPALKKVYGWEHKGTQQCTKVMSQVLNYRRFGFGHSLKQWGNFFKDYKGDYDGGWEEFNEDMFEYMKQDIRLGVKVYNYLVAELKNYIKRSGSKSILSALRNEMSMDAIMVKQCQNGWQFDVEGAKKLLSDIEKRTKEIEELINPQLPARIKAVDNESKKPKFTKIGKPVSWMRNWFQLSDECSVDTCPIWGEFSRIEIITGDIGNTDTVKKLLYTLGWKPDEWNWKKVNGEFVKVSPKLTDSSLEPLGEVGSALSEYYTLRSRKSILEGWFPHVDANGRLHGDVFNIGTPTFRQTHKIIANLPSGKAVLGKEFRELFITRPGYKLVSADSAACQLRLLAHYLKDDEFTHTILEGDIHQKNADILGCSRNTAKPFIFAFLYGAGGKKLGSILGVSEREGNRKKNDYLNSLPFLKKLIESVQNIVEVQGYIPGLDDRPIHAESAHKALNYLIQGAEAVVMKYTVVMIEEELEKAGLDASILLFYHDEVTYEVREDQAEEAQAIIRRCFEEAPKKLGVEIMTCGDCKIGNDYYEVH